LSSNLDEQVEEQFLVESHERVENVVNGEDDVEIGDRQKPEFLCFEPLRFLECSTRGAMPIFSGFVVEFPTFTFRADFQDTTQSRRAAIHDGAHNFGLFIRKAMSFFVFANMFAEDVSHFELRPRLLR
jgi:hypothetical protein